MVAVMPLQRERAGEVVPATRGLSDRYPARRCGDLGPEPSRSVGREQGQLADIRRKQNFLRHSSIRRLPAE